MPRPIELIIALLLLLLLAPLMLAVALMIRLRDGRGVLLRQVRIGRHGRPFAMLKFRTMYHDAESLLRDHLEQSAEARREWEEQQMLREDPRVLGRYARAIRRHSLDELPQLINVLRGEMSLVGPRPLTPEHYRALDRETAGIRERVRPGMTGLWQISGRDTLPLERRWELDRIYVERRSALEDLRILFGTLREVVWPAGM